MVAGGIFAEWQPVYAEAGIPTFPVADKKPAVRGYLKTGPNGSAALAAGKFGEASALGFACKRAGLTIVDVDTTDENILADALARFGDTSVIVRSGSGHYQAWYRNNGEPRKIRPDKDTPIDILGGGYVVAPPSKGAKGSYQFLSGSLDDLAALPYLRQPETPAVEPVAGVELVNVGQRNDALWRACMRHARGCASFDDLLSFAHGANAEILATPLPDAEVVTLAQSAWAKTCSGDNRFGAEMLVGLPVSKFDRIASDPFALSLYMTLRRRWRDGETFAVANDMHKAQGWPRRKFVEARTALETHRLIVMVKRPSKAHGAAAYRFG